MMKWYVIDARKGWVVHEDSFGGPCYDYVDMCVYYHRAGELSDYEVVNGSKERDAMIRQIKNLNNRKGR